MSSLINLYVQLDSSNFSCGKFAVLQKAFDTMVFAE